MIINDQVDLDELVKTCNCLKEYFVQTSNTERKPVEIFLALMDKTIVYIEDGSNSADLVFDANEICEASFNPKDNYSAAKEFITRNRKGFDKLIKENLESIAHFCSLNEVKFLPNIKNTESQGGHKTFFYIGLTPLSNNINHKVELKSKHSNVSNIAIEYAVPQLPKAATWAKPLLNLKISGWKFYSYITIPILAVVITYCLLLWNIYAISDTSLKYTIIIGSLLVVLYCLFTPFYEAIDKRVGLAPIWLTKLRISSAQLRYIRTDKKRPNGNNVRALQLVVYQAKCPICGNEVLIEKGKYAHKGRLVGVCNESPREHVFTFDHVTKKGRLLT